MNDILIISLAYLSFAVIHSLFSSDPMKAFFRKRWPRFFAFYRLTFNGLQTLLFGVMILFVPKPSVPVWQVEGALVLLFRLLQILSLIALGLAFRDFSTSEFLGLGAVRRFFQGEHTATTDEHYQLNTTGFYAVSRHPLYLFSITLFLFQPKMTRFLFVSLVWMIIYFYTGSIFEERRLVRHFGDRYRLYRKQVSRIVPLKWCLQVCRITRF